MVMEAAKEKKHALKMNIRKSLELSGVVSVERFDRDRFDLQTDCGALHIQGQNLHIKTLNLEQGLLIIEGYVHGMHYTDGRPVKKNKTWIGKMFR
jgi:sporulation protein YabP